jgi:hypothetical protein
VKFILNGGPGEAPVATGVVLAPQIGSLFRQRKDARDKILLHHGCSFRHLGLEPESPAPALDLLVVVEAAVPRASWQRLEPACAPASK